MSPTSTLIRNRRGVSLVILELLGSDWVALEPAEPVAGKREPGLVERVDAGAAAARVAHQAGGLERLEVARGGRPGMGEQAGDAPRAQLAAGEVEADQDAAPRRMGKRGEDGFISVRHANHLAWTL